MDIQTKEIQITNLSVKEIKSAAGSFNIYQIQGNDGITYETVDQKFYSERSPGEKIALKYRVVTKQAPNGRMYTNYKVILPRTDRFNFEEMEKRIRDQISLLEKNILAAIKAHGGEAKIDLEEGEEPGY